MKAGDRYDRWEVVRASSPAKDHANAEGVRPRVYVRCVCGHERVVFCQVLTRGQSTGCSSRRCKARWEAANELRGQLDAWLMQWIKAAREPLELIDEGEAG